MKRKLLIRHSLTRARPRPYPTPEDTGEPSYTHKEPFLGADPVQDPFLKRVLLLGWEIVLCCDPTPPHLEISQQRKKLSNRARDQRRNEAFLKQFT